MSDDGYYWHLYPYFESAKLPSPYELVDLYGDSIIDGYELDRLRERLIIARNDLQWRGESWEVVTGWNGQTLRPETENRRTVEKSVMIATIDRLIAIIDHCKVNAAKLCVSGD